MVPSALRFVPYEEYADVANIVVDGSPNAGTVLVVSHWPGLLTPPGCAADTSAQMVFRYLERGADLHGGAGVVDQQPLRPGRSGWRLRTRVPRRGAASPHTA